MKRNLLMLLMVVGMTLTAMGANIFSISTVEGAPGETVIVDVGFENDSDIVVAELTIPLVNKQLTYIDGSCSLNTDRINGHQVSAGMTDKGLRIIIYNIGLNPLVGNSGNLLSFRLRLGKDPMTYPLTASVIVGDANGKQLDASVSNGSVTILAPELTIVTTSIDYGHIPIRSSYTRSISLKNSGNQKLTISDAQFSAPEFSTKQIPMVIEPGATKNMTINYAPINRGSISETVTFISDAINGKQKATLVADPFSVNELHIGKTSGNSDEEATITLTMNNMEPIVGMQCSFTMPEQLVFVEGSFKPSQRAASHLAHATMEGNRLTLFMYSASNAEMAGDDGEIATFKVRLNGRNGTYYLHPTDVVLSNITIENMVSATSYGYVTIQSPVLSCNSSLDMGISPVTETTTSSFALRNTGKIPLTIDRVTFLAEGYRVTDKLPINIAAGKSANINVAYTPSVRGSHSTTMNIYTNDPDNRMKTVAVSGEIFEPNYIRLSGEEQADGYDLIISLENYTDIVALQLDIKAPANMTTDGNQLSLSNRLNGLAASLWDIGDDTYRVVVYSLSNAKIVGNNGELLRVKFSGSEFLNSVVNVGNIIISNAKSENMASHKDVSFVIPPTLVKEVAIDKQEVSLRANDTATLAVTVLPAFATDKSIVWTSSDTSVATVDQTGTVKAIGVGEATITATAADGSGRSASCMVTVLATSGDVNNDGKINITDIIATASYILGNNPTRFVFEAADMNHSNSINVTDIIGIASIILNGGASHSPKAFSPATESSDYLHAENFGIGEHQSKSLSINLHNTRNYTAFQMDVHIPEGLRIEDCKLSDRGSDHTIDYQVMTEGVVRVIAYSISNSAFAGNDGCLVELTLSADDSFEGATISIDEIIFAEADMTEHHFDAISLDADYVGIDDVENDACKVYADGQAIIIESSCAQSATISRIDGISHLVELSEGKNEIKVADRGVYIVKTNSKTTKLIIK